MIQDIEKTEKERIKKKGLQTLKKSGILDSYQCKQNFKSIQLIFQFLFLDLLTSLCKYGLPTGDLYEFAALQVLRYEKKQKSLKKKELDDRLKKREEKKRENSLIALTQKEKEDKLKKEKSKKANRDLRGIKDPGTDS